MATEKKTTSKRRPKYQRSALIAVRKAAT